jgi:hypothetical protein
MATKSRKKTQKTDSDPEPFFVTFCDFRGPETFVRKNLRTIQRN